MFFYVGIAAVGSMVGGITIINNAISGDEVNWSYFPIAGVLIFFSLKNIFWMIRKRVVVNDTAITIHLPFAFFKPIRFDKRYVIGYGELTENDKDYGIYQLLRVLDENGKKHEIQSWTVPEYDEIISFLKKHHVKKFGIKLFEKELARRRIFKKNIETFFTIGGVVLFFVMMFYFVYYTFF